MKKRKKRLMSGMVGAAVALVVLAGSAGSAWAGAVITSGEVSLGVNDKGDLNFFAPGTLPGQTIGSVGLYFAHPALIGLPHQGDALSPGCLCEGWGVAGNGISGGVSESNPAPGNLTLVVPFSSTATTATSDVKLTSLPDLEAIQAYAPSAGAPTALFEDMVTIKNNGSGTITDIRYRRAMDWDIPPTEFSEFVTIGGLPAANLLYSSDNGFGSVDPLSGPTFLSAASVNTNFTDLGPADHGALFDFGFGALGPGESRTFSIFYGATGDEADAFTALGSVGAELYSLGQSSGSDPTGLPRHISGEPATYIFGFKGVGGTPIGTPVIPEPGTLSLLTLGLAGMGFATRKRLF